MVNSGHKKIIGKTILYISNSEKLSITMSPLPIVIKIIWVNRIESTPITTPATPGIPAADLVISQAFLNSPL